MALRCRCPGIQDIGSFGEDTELSSGHHEFEVPVGHLVESFH